MSNVIVTIEKQFSKGFNIMLMVNNIVRSKYIFVENNKIKTLFSNYIFGLTFQSPSSK